MGFSPQNFGSFTPPRTSEGKTPNFPFFFCLFLGFFTPKFGSSLLKKKPQISQFWDFFWEDFGVFWDGSQIFLGSPPSFLFPDFLKAESQNSQPVFSPFFAGFTPKFLGFSQLKKGKLSFFEPFFLGILGFIPNILGFPLFCLLPDFLRAESRSSHPVFSRFWGFSSQNSCVLSS